VAESDSTKHVVHIVAKIPLAALHDIFRQYPLVKSSLMRFTFFLNAPATATMTYSGNDAASKLLTSMSVTSPHGSFPVSVAPYASQVRMADDANACVQTVNVRIGNSAIGAKSNHPLQQCQLMCCMMELNANVEKAYVGDPKKTFVYDETVHSVWTQGGSGDSSQKTTIVSSGLSRLRKMVLIYTNAESTALIPAARQNPFDSAGFMFTSSPNVNLTNLQVAVSGQNVFPEALSTDFAQWHETKQALMNGGDLYSKINMGLLSFDEWQAGNYRHLVFDLSRVSAAEADDLMKSITIQFACDVKCEFVAIVYTERSMTVHAESGQIII
jgi:hypothetical protein